MWKYINWIFFVELISRITGAAFLICCLLFLDEGSQVLYFVHDLDRIVIEKLGTYGMFFGFVFIGMFFAFGINKIKPVEKIAFNFTIFKSSLKYINIKLPSRKSLSPSRKSLLIAIILSFIHIIPSIEVPTLIIFLIIIFLIIFLIFLTFFLIKLFQLFPKLFFKEIETKTYPNQGVFRSIQNSLFFGIIVAVIFGYLSIKTGYVDAAIDGDFLRVEESPFSVSRSVFIAKLWLIFDNISLGLIIGMVFGGGKACIQHLSLRLILYCNSFCSYACLLKFFPSYNRLKFPP